METFIKGDYKYVIKENEAIIHSYIGREPSIVVPSQIDGYMVKKIHAQAFKYKELKSVIIPNTVSEIGFEAFAQNKLRTLIIPDSVIEIGEGAFKGNKLNYVLFSDSVEIIGDRAFEDNKLKYLILPESIKEIRDFAFKGNFLIKILMRSDQTTVSTKAFPKSIFKPQVTKDKKIDIPKINALWTSFKKFNYDMVWTVLIISYLMEDSFFKVLSSFAILSIFLAGVSFIIFILAFIFQRLKDQKISFRSTDNSRF
jgi:hypothetical protein